MTRPPKRHEDVVIYDLSERAPAGNILKPLFRVNNTYFYSREEALRVGRELAEKASVVGWLQRGVELELLVNHRPATSLRRS